MKVRNVRLTITEMCNLNCVYCYEKHKSNKMMSINDAHQIINREFLRAEKECFEQLNIEFFGGEPFLNFPLIKDISEYVLHRHTCLNVSLSAVTNGTAFTDDSKKWLFDHKNHFDLGFSIDGGKLTQNQNRSNSFDLLDLNFVATYPRASIKATISQMSVTRLAEDMQYLHSFKCPVGCNIDYDANWTVDNALLDLFAAQLKMLIDYYLHHPSIVPCSLLNMPIQTVLNKPVDYIMRPCGAGTSVVTYSCDGEVFPCQGFMPLSQNSVSESVIKKLLFQERIPVKLFGADCMTCPIVNSCPNCFASNFILRGNLYRKPKELCKLIKLFYKASAYLKFLQLKAGCVNMSQEEKIRTLFGIKTIQEQFV